MQTPRRNDVLDLRVGEVVEVRSRDEILATLDQRGEFEALPFMPEMLQFCGRRFRVDKLAVKSVRHDQLERDVPNGSRGTSGRRALRRSGPRRLPGRLPRLLEGGLAQAGRRRRRRGRSRPVVVASARPGLPGPDGNDPQGR